LKNDDRDNRRTIIVVNRAEAVEDTRVTEGLNDNNVSGRGSTLARAITIIHFCVVY